MGYIKVVLCAKQSPWAYYCAIMAHNRNVWHVRLTSMVMINGSNHWDFPHLAFKGDVTSNVKLPPLMVHSVTNHLVCVCNDGIVKFDHIYKVSMGWTSNGAIISYP